MKHLTLKALGLLTFSLIINSTANAALSSRLGGLAFYDDILDVTWLADANLAASETFGLATFDTYGTGRGVLDPHPSDSSGYEGYIVSPSGSMNWPGALHWLDAMNRDGGAGYLGFSDWRLPNVDVNGDGAVLDCSGGSVSGCIDNEYGSLFWETGITGVSSGDFLNLRATFYWSGHEPTSTTVSLFRFDNGREDIFSKGSYVSTLVVRDGDVSVTNTVPEPPMLALLGTVFAGLAGFKRKRS